MVAIVAGLKALLKNRNVWLWCPIWDCSVTNKTITWHCRHLWTKLKLHKPTLVCFCLLFWLCVFLTVQNFPYFWVNLLFQLVQADTPKWIWGAGLFSINRIKFHLNKCIFLCPSNYFFMKKMHDVQCAEFISRPLSYLDSMEQTSAGRSFINITNSFDWNLFSSLSSKQTTGSPSITWLWKLNLQQAWNTVS